MSMYDEHLHHVLEEMRGYSWVKEDHHGMA